MRPEHVANPVELIARLPAADLLLTQAGKLRGTTEDDLRKPAAGRADLRAEVAGTLEGFAEGELHEPHAGVIPQAAQAATSATGLLSRQAV